MPIVKSISGIRATLDELTKPFIAKNITAFHRLMPEGKIIIGRDGRLSGAWIERYSALLLRKLGRDVEIIGVVPTPTVQLYVKNSDAIGGVVVTASHNPATWNGLKLMGADGVFLDNEQNKELYEMASTIVYNYKNKIPSVPKENYGKIYYKGDAISKHIENILSLKLFEKIIPIIKSKNYRIVVDAVNASGGDAMRQLLSELNCQMISLYCSSNGIFPHDPEPIPTNLIELSSAVKEHDADLGIAVDPDADRLVLIDNNGEAIGEEKTICIAIQSLFEIKNYLNNPNDLNIKKPVVVVNQSTTQLADDISKKYNSEIVRAAVGEINVVRRMQEVGAEIGGEGSGGVILPDSHYGRDSLIGTVLTLALLAIQDTTLSEVNAQYPDYEMQKNKIIFNGDFSKLCKKIQNEFYNHHVSLIDGIKIYFDDSWIHMRVSNTEPIIRIIAEAKNKAQIESMMQQVIQYF